MVLDFFDFLKKQKFNKVNDRESGSWELTPIEDMGIAMRQEPSQEEFEALTGISPKDQRTEKL
jgi:hypothetical protein